MSKKAKFKKNRKNRQKLQKSSKNRKNRQKIVKKLKKSQKSAAGIIVKYFSGTVGRSRRSPLTPTDRDQMTRHVNRKNALNFI